MTQLSRGAGRQLGVTGNKAQDEGRQSSHEGGGQAGPARTPSSNRTNRQRPGPGRPEGRETQLGASITPTGPVTPAGPTQEPCNVKMSKPSQKGLRSHTPSEEAEGEPYPAASNLSPAPPTGSRGPAPAPGSSPTTVSPPTLSAIPRLTPRLGGSGANGWERRARETVARPPGLVPVSQPTAPLPAP